MEFRDIPIKAAAHRVDGDRLLRAAIVRVNINPGWRCVWRMGVIDTGATGDKRRGGMSNKFIPDGDHAFRDMAEVFAYGIARDPDAYFVSASEAASISEAVNAYCEALNEASRRATRTKLTIQAKDEARVEAERIIRKYGNLIRANDAISEWAKQQVRVRERPRRLKRQACPQRPPYFECGGSGGWRSRAGVS